MKNSLKKGKEFLSVYEHKKCVVDKYFCVYSLKNNLEYNRIGISVSKRVGNSVVRHKITRQIREIFKDIDKKLGYDFVIVARIPSRDIDFFKKKSSIERLINKIN